MPRNKVTPLERQARHEISKNLKYYSRNITQRKLSDITDIPASTLSGYFSESSTPSSGSLEKIAKALHIKKSDIDPRYAIEDTPNDNMPSNVKRLINKDTTIIKIPVLGTIACGDPITAEQNVDGYITETYNDTVPSGTLFALKAKGDSMKPTIPNGSMVIIQEQPTVEDGEVAAVLVNGDTEATLKRVKHINGIVMLQPDNNDFDPIILNEDNPGRIIGRAIEVKSKL